MSSVGAVSDYKLTNVSFFLKLSYDQTVLSRHHTAEAIADLVRLRRVERVLDHPQADELRVVGEHLRALVGLTVRPSLAARALGISHPALSRWLESGDIATVITPEGRREIPLSELLALLDDLDQLDEGEREGRPLSRVIRARHRRAETAVDADRLLPPVRARGHRPAELRALAYHRLVADRLDEDLVADASRRIARWRETGRIHPSWADAWEDILAEPLPAIARAIASDTPKARELRQTSPFAGALNEQERTRLGRAVRERIRS